MRQVEVSSAIFVGGAKLRRRDVLAALAWGMAIPAFARDAAGRLLVAFVGLASEEADRPLLGPIRARLAALGYIEGETITLIDRHAAGDLALSSRQIDELVALGTDVFVVPGPAAARIIKTMSDRPIVAGGLPLSDPFLFASLSRPGGTVTGLSSFGEDLAAKRVEVIREALPELKRLGVMHNGTDPIYRDWGEQSEKAAHAAGLAAARLMLTTATDEEIDRLLRNFKQDGGGAVLVIRDFLTHTNRATIGSKALVLGRPIIAEHPSFLSVGALVGYGEDVEAAMGRLGDLVDRVLKGEDPAELPIELPTRFRLELNLKVAKALGIEFPTSLLARADAVLE